MIGETVSHYRVLLGLGEVYEAEDSRLGRQISGFRCADPVDELVRH
jgi:hypothetical protein